MHPSPVASDGKIYVGGENDNAVVLRQGRQLETLSVNDLGESCLATPALADGRLFIRTLTKLFCFGNAQ